MRADKADHSAEHRAWLRRRDRATHPPTRHRVRRVPRPPWLGHQTNAGLAVWLPAADRPLRTPRPPVQHLPHPRHLHHLLQELTKFPTGDTLLRNCSWTPEHRSSSGARPHTPAEAAAIFQVC